MNLPTRMTNRPLRKLSALQRYLCAVILTLAATVVSGYLHNFLAPTNLVMVFLLAVVLAAAFLGRRPSIVVSVLGILAFDFFFIPPYFTLTVDDTQYILTFVGLFGVGMIISELTVRVHDQMETAQKREAETATLYSLSRSLAIADGVDEIIDAITTNVSQTFSRDVTIFLPGADSKAKVTPFTPNPNFDEYEETTANLAFQSGLQAGRGTDLLPMSKARYLPLKTAQGVVGVLAARPKNPGSQLSADQLRILETFASQAALAIERAQLAENARQARFLKETEKLQTALLNSISHDLRTPLASITGALSSLLANGMSLDGEGQRSLIETAQEEADRLNRLVRNLLNMTRIEAGAMRLSIELEDVQDAIGSALEQVKKQLNGRQVSIELPETLPLAPMDFVLFVQVLVNLLDNAIKYSSPSSPVEIRVCPAGQILEVQILDRGIGIPAEDLPLIFDKFFRARRPHQISGSGLGLSICKGIMDAHHGTIRVENRPGGGTAATVGLRLETAEAEPMEQPEKIE